MQLKTNASDLGNKNGEKNRTSDLSYFIKKNTLIMISHKFLKPFLMFTGSIEKTCGWKSKRLSEESNTTPATSYNGFSPKLNYIYNSTTAESFEENWKRQNKVFFTQRNVIKLFVAYEFET